MDARRTSDLLDLADRAVAGGEWNAVLQHTEAILTADPNHAEAAMLRGTALRQLAKLPSHTERRFITVMFVDLVGSTALSEALDPEDFAAVLHRYHRLVAESIEPFGGRVAKLLGDGVMAQFGYPTAIEHAPRRAVLAGQQVIADLAAQSSWFHETAGSPVECRVGIHSGTAVVESGDVVGDVPNVAAAIEAGAAIGGVAVSSATKDLLAGQYSFEDRPSPKDDQVVAYRVTAATNGRPDRSHDLVGRAGELSSLGEAWAKVQRGHRQQVLVIGDAGMGKSRLLAELRTLVEPGGIWVEGGSSEFKGDQPFHLFLDAIDRQLRQREIDRRNLTAVSMHLGVTEADADLVLSTGRRAAALHPAQARRAVMRTIVGWLHKLARARPVTLALEDLHWADPSSREMLDDLLAALHDVAVLIVLTSRNDEVLANADTQSTVRLEPLSRRHAESLAGTLVADIGPATRASIAERAGGVPLFVTELARSVKAGTTGEQLPHSLRDLLAARVDSLGTAKRGAQVASVLGRTSTVELIRVLDPALAGSERWLEELAEGGLIERTNGSVRFVHSLLQDAAYESLLISERRRMHTRAAEALIQRGTADGPGIIAHHLTEAGDTRRAIDHWMEAGGVAASHSASQEALGLYRRAESLIAELETGPQRDGLELALHQAMAAPLTAVYGYAAKEVEEAYTAAARLGAATGDPGQAFATLRGLTSNRLLRAEIEPARALGGQALDIALDTGDDHLLVEARTWLGTCEFFAGRLDDAHRLLDEAAATYDDSHRRHGLEFGLDPLTLAESHRAWLHQLEGRGDEALAAALGTVDHARSLDHPLSLAHSLNYLAGVHQMQGDADAQLQVAAEEVDLATEHGFVHYIHYGGILKGHAQSRLGDGAAVAATIDSLRARLGAGAALAQPYHRWLIADAHLHHGDPSDAAEALNGARTVALETAELWWLAAIDELIGSIGDV